MIVLFVEDDQKLAQQVIDYLSVENIELDYVAVIAGAKQISEKQHYDAIILDMNLPDGNGVELASYFQQHRAETPIIFLTGQDNLLDKLAAFEAGALDYLTKPFELAELAVRLKVLCNKGKAISAQFSLENLNINFTSKVVMRGDRVITLSPQQWKLLALLAKKSPAYLSKQEIIDNIWPERDVTNDMYKSLLSRLRTNLMANNETNLLVIAKKEGVALRGE